MKERAGRAIRMQAANGMQFVRTHVDVTDPRLVAMEAMLELREELKNEVTVQIVALPQEGILSYPNGKALMENALYMNTLSAGTEGLTDRWKLKSVIIMRRSSRKTVDS